MRISKDLIFHERYSLRLVADFFNLTNSGNLYSDPDVGGFVPLTGCHLIDPTKFANQTCNPLTAFPTAQNTPGFRVLDELAPGASAFAVQFGVRFQF
jgi:hypothetical protein